VAEDSTAPGLREDYGTLTAAVGVPDLDIDLLVHSLTHRSYAYENGGLPTNERLEFLGDSVLGLIVTDRLYTKFPDLSEGRLAKLRAAVVNARALAEVGRSLDLGAYVRLGRGEETTGGRDKSSILSDTVEAIIGAVYLQFGFARASEVVLSLFDPLITAAAKLGAGLDWKTSLQELGADAGLGVPEYLIEEEGPDHEKTFTAQVRVGERVYGRGVGRSKKAAEQEAAETAWREIKAASDALDGEDGDSASAAAAEAAASAVRES
jgi:ribonuclease-3